MLVQSVSVIVPAFKATATLDLCLGSLLAQQSAPAHYEIIVVDDASPDNTADMAETYIKQAAEKGITLQILRLEKNGGPARARNAGARIAKGDIIIFTDSDCELTPQWLGEMLAGFDDPTIDAVKGAYKTRQKEIGARFAQIEFEERYRMLEAAETIDVVFSYSAAFRRDVFLGLNGFDETFPVADNEDTDLSWRLIDAGHKAVFRPNALLYHRHPPRLYDYYRKKISRGYWRIIVYRRFPEKAVKDSYTPQSLKVQILLAYLALMAVPLSLIFPTLWAVVGFLLLGFGLTTLPFVVQSWRSDPLVAMLSPVLLLGRALSIGAGVIKAIPQTFNRNPILPEYKKS